MANWRKTAERLEKECGWARPIAVAFAWAGGRCEYCGCGLLHDRLGYAAGELDHLLPKKLYPDLIDCPDNWVLSCHLCNNIKATLDVAEKHQSMDAGSLNKHRDVFITEARKHIYARRAESHDDH